jgi:endonuclease III
MDEHAALSHTVGAADLPAVEAALAAAYGPRPYMPGGDPVAELVGTILSQNTSDTNTARAFASLRSRFPDWDDLVAAPVSEVADAIRSGGLANIKAPRIQQALRDVARRAGGYDLRFLNEMPVPAARAWLTEIPGVGPKTASCVLLFTLGLPAMPVDTHVHRVSLRLGLVPPKTSAEAAHPLLEARLGDDAGRAYALHMRLIAHGRTVCVARNPRCGVCPLATICPSASVRPESRS